MSVFLEVDFRLGRSCRDNLWRAWDGYRPTGAGRVVGGVDNYTVDASNPAFYAVHLGKTFKVPDMIDSALCWRSLWGPTDTPKDIHLTETVANSTDVSWFDYQICAGNQPDGDPGVAMGWSALRHA